MKIIQKKIILKLSSFYNLRFNFCMKHLWSNFDYYFSTLQHIMETVFCYRNIIIVEKSEYKDFIVKF